MADEKVSAKTELTVAPAPNDLLLVVDMDGATDALKSKSVAVATLFDVVVCWESEPLAYENNLVTYGV